MHNEHEGTPPAAQLADRGIGGGGGNRTRRRMDDSPFAETEFGCGWGRKKAVPTASEPALRICSMERGLLLALVFSAAVYALVFWGWA